ncbi:MAG: 2-amino-4-hydroxy-6-hydroxymethyldihydropteridine diphosphokinase [Verrucomicrobiales bacterium]
MIRQPTTRELVGVRIRRCGIGLGSNLGDRLLNLRLAARALDLLADFAHPVLRAPIYESDPVDCAGDASPFYNTVIEIGYFGEPDRLLERLRSIETALGRPPQREKNVPRIIDLDLLYADDLILAEPELELPHPRLHLRRFVLQPLAEVRPNLRLPGQAVTVFELLSRLPLGEPPLRFVTEEW